MNTIFYGISKANRNSYFNSIGTNGSTKIISTEETNTLLREVIAKKEAHKKAIKTANTRSKVCLIANQLKRNGENSSTAFKKAWAIVKMATVETKVAGVTFGNRQKALERLTHYNAEQISVNLKRETDNKFDKNAIAIIATVKDKGSYPVGYLDKRLAALIAPLIDKGKAVTAKFNEIRGKYQNYHNYGMAVNLTI